MPTPSPKALRAKITLLELLSTQSLVTPIKTLYLLHFLMQNADISFFKLVFTFFSFAFELPSGYFSDRCGNRHAVLLSRTLIAASFLFYLLTPDFYGFLLTNLLLGIGDAWESGAKDSYFLGLSTAHGLDYRQLKIDIAKYSYAVNFGLAFVSTLLYAQSIYLPVLLTVLFYAAAAVLLLTMPAEPRFGAPEKSKGFLSLSAQIAGKLLKNKALLLEMVFATTCTSILISNFDFYSSLFTSAGISVEAIGIIYSSFNHYSVQKIKELSPEAETAYLIGDVMLDVAAYTKNTGIKGLHPALFHVKMADFLKEYKESGIALRVWTVNEKDQIRWLIDEGVDAVITNYPDRGLEARVEAEAESREC